MTGLAPCRIISLGRMAYLDAWAIQKRLAEARSADLIPDTLLFVEHPHTYTLGSGGHMSNVLLSPEELATRGIELHHVDRGGDVTYHGPGQLVGYPIMKLPQAGSHIVTSGGLHADVLAYVRGLEKVLIDALAVYRIVAWPFPGYTGVWLGDAAAPAKIAAIGVRVSARRVTLHGFALNVNTDLAYFAGIIPCGIADKAVTSMQAALGYPLILDEIAITIAQAFGVAFGREMLHESAPALAELGPDSTGTR